MSEKIPVSAIDLVKASMTNIIVLTKSMMKMRVLIGDSGSKDALSIAIETQAIMIQIIIQDSNFGWEMIAKQNFLKGFKGSKIPTFKINLRKKNQYI